MSIQSFRDALNQAMFEEMRRDDTVIVLGEDVSGGAGGTSGQRDAAGGIFGVTKGLIHEFGEDRVIDTPISEEGYTGVAIGAAFQGLKPIVEFQFIDFIACAFNPLTNFAATSYFRWKANVPMVVAINKMDREEADPDRVKQELANHEVIPESGLDATLTLAPPCRFCAHAAICGRAFGGEA